MFNAYRDRLSSVGTNDREAIKTQTRVAREVSFSNSQTFTKVTVEGKSYDARLISDVNDTIKTGDGNMAIEFRDGVLFYPGTYVEIQNPFGDVEYWMIMDVLDSPIAPRTLIKKCTYHLYWKNSAGNIVDRWIIIDDSYKLYDQVRNYGYKTNLSESTITINLPYDPETILIKYDQRFIIDVESVDIPNVYSVTNRNAIARRYGDKGVVKLTMTQDQFNHETDNSELMIADYYHGEEFVPEPPAEASDMRISYGGHNKIVMGTPYKEFKIEFFDSKGNVVDDTVGMWEILLLSDVEHLFDYQIEGNVLKIKAEYDESIIDYQFTIAARDLDGTMSASVNVKVVSGI